MSYEEQYIRTKAPWVYEGEDRGLTLDQKEEIAEARWEAENER